jgi:hypothetical protein
LILSDNEWFLLTWTSVIAVITGAAFVAITPQRWPVVMSAFVGAPFAAAIVLSQVMFVLGIISGVQAGWGPLRTLGAGLASGVFYGFGASLFGAPGAVLGGCLGAIIRHYRTREDDR